jgi:uncharacterized protein YukE
MSQAAQLSEIATALRTTAGNYDTTSTDLGGVTAAVSIVAEGLLTSWQGASSQAFATACNQIWGDGQNVGTSLGTASAALNAVAASIDSNIGPIETYTNPAFQSYTIDPNELTAAKQAADTALAAIAAVALSQAAAVNGAAATVGVCSTGEGGPWDGTGLNQNALDGLKGLLRGKLSWLNGYSNMPGFWQGFLRVVFVGVANTWTAIQSTYITPNALGFLIPTLLTNFGGGFLASGIIDSIYFLGIDASETSSVAILQALIGGFTLGSLTSLGFWIVDPKTGSSGGVTPSVRTLANGDEDSTTTEEDGSTTSVTTNKEGKVVQITVNSYDGTPVEKVQITYEPGGEQVTVTSPEGETTGFIPTPPPSTSKPAATNPVTQRTYGPAPR